jgi:uncharacterized protein (DUF433 family)
MNWTRHLSSTPSICGGQLCAKGTRVPVTVILDSLAEGASEREMLRSYPTLKPVTSGRLSPTRRSWFAMQS